MNQLYDINSYFVINQNDDYLTWVKGPCGILSSLCVCYRLFTSWTNYIYDFLSQNTDWHWRWFPGLDP